MPRNRQSPVPEARSGSICQRRRSSPDETIFQRDENVLKQKPEQLVVSKTGTVAMQFILDLIWNQSRSKYLVSIAERKAQS